MVTGDRGWMCCAKEHWQHKHINTTVPEIGTNIILHWQILGAGPPTEAADISGVTAHNFGQLYSASAFCGDYGDKWFPMSQRRVNP